jgi:hypothetical protein
VFPGGGTFALASFAASAWIDTEIFRHASNGYIVVQPVTRRKKATGELFGILVAMAPEMLEKSRNRFPRCCSRG